MILKIFGAVLLLCISAFLLRCFGWRGAPVFALVCVIIILNESSEALSGIFNTVNSVSALADMGEPLGAALKILGLGYLFGISADICRELSESGIAKAVEVVGRVEIIAVVMPFFEEIIRVGVELIG